MRQFNHDDPSQAYTYTVGFQPHDAAPEAQHSQSQEYSQPYQQQSYQQGYGQPYQQQVPPYEGASASYTMPHNHRLSRMSYHRFRSMFSLLHTHALKMVSSWQQSATSILADRFPAHPLYA